MGRKWRANTLCEQIKYNKIMSEMLIEIPILPAIRDNEQNEQKYGLNFYFQRVTPVRDDLC